MFGKIRHNHGLEAAAALPSGAVVQREGKNIVLLEERAGTFREVEVTVGARKGDMVAILSGVKSGDRVVVDGPMLLGKD
jgi:multidrug efflux pump subunit AcrA (membrane-fusion protein)